MVVASTNVARTLNAGRAGLTLAGRAMPFLFTVDDVSTMVAQGILPEDSTTELVGGIIMLKNRADAGEDPMVHGAKHRLAIRRLMTLAGRIETPRRHAQVQLPIICGPRDMPEPDFAIIRGQDSDYATRLPSAADVLVVIEAADSSFDYDTEEKMAMYAAAGIPAYFVLNLASATVEQFTEPDSPVRIYRQRLTLGKQEVLHLPGEADGIIEVSAAELLA